MDPFTLALLGSSAASAVMGQRASSQAAQAQSGAAMQSALLQAQAQQQAIQEQRAARGQAMDLFNRGVGYQEPYTTAGVGATNRLATLLGIGPDAGAAGYGSYMEQPTLNQIQMDPGYAFRERQGMKALNQSMAARGLGVSGSGIRGAQEFGQGLASQEYGNAYNRFMQNRAAAAGMLQNMAGTGASTAGNIGSQAANVGSAGMQGAAQTANMLAMSPISQGMENAAQARASGYMGGATALGQALQSIPQNYMMYSMMDKFAPNGTQYAGMEQLPSIFQSGGVLNSIFGK